MTSRQSVEELEDLVQAVVSTDDPTVVERARFALAMIVSNSSDAPGDIE